MASETEHTHPYLKYEKEQMTRCKWTVRLRKSDHRTLVLPAVILAAYRRRTEISHTDTGGCSEVGFVAHVTVAAEGSDGVDTLAVAARILQHLALIDVCRQGHNKQSHLECLICQSELCFMSPSYKCTLE